MGGGGADGSGVLGKGFGGEFIVGVGGGED